MLGILGKQPQLGCTRPKFGERYPVERIKMLGILVYTPFIGPCIPVGLVRRLEFAGASFVDFCPAELKPSSVDLL